MPFITFILNTAISSAASGVEPWVANTGTLATAVKSVGGTYALANEGLFAAYSRVLECADFRLESDPAKTIAQAISPSAKLLDWRIDARHRKQNLTGGGDVVSHFGNAPSVRVYGPDSTSWATTTTPRSSGAFALLDGTWVTNSFMPSNMSNPNWMTISRLRSSLFKIGLQLYINAGSFAAQTAEGDFDSLKLLVDFEEVSGVEFARRRRLVLGLTS